MGEVKKVLCAGGVAALATDTVYGLAANAFDEAAIGRIYQLKKRPQTMALQILVGTVEQARRLVVWNEWAERAARAYWPGGLTLILRPNETGVALRRGFEGLGLRVPGHTGLQKLLAELDFPLACTSANAHGCPVITTEQELISFANGNVDLILPDGDLSACASSVVDVMESPRLLREGCIPRVQLEKTLGCVLK